MLDYVEADQGCHQVSPEITRSCARGLTTVESLQITLIHSCLTTLIALRDALGSPRLIMRQNEDSPFPGYFPLCSSCRSAPKR